jgi:hypothetical protein
MSVDIRREADELVRYYAELVRRLGQNGVRDIPHLVSLHDQLRRALDAISKQEIGWVSDQAERLIEALVGMDANLQALRRLKAELADAPGPVGVDGAGRRDR